MLWKASLLSVLQLPAPFSKTPHFNSVLHVFLRCYIVIEDMFFCFSQKEAWYTHSFYFFYSLPHHFISEYKVLLHSVLWWLNILCGHATIYLTIPPLMTNQDCSHYRRCSEKLARTLEVLWVFRIISEISMQIKY